MTLFGQDAWELNLRHGGAEGRRDMFDRSTEE